VLVGFFVENWLDFRVGVLLHLVKVLLKDKLAPYLNNFAKEGFSFYETAFFFE
jgi:hypothetical protein